MILNKSLLIVDDDENNRNILCRRLKKEGYTVISAYDGQEALNLLRFERFDMILLDVMMPDIDGYEVLLRIKADSNSLDTPVIMISAIGDKDSIINCLGLGASDYLLKPYNMDIVNARIRRCLGKWHGVNHERNWQAMMRNSNVLIVEDDEFNRDLLQRRVEQNGFNTACASNGKEALEVLENEKFDLLLLDLMMPGIDGIEVLKRIKADAKYARIPVIMVSALDDSESIATCMHHGAIDYITKPFNAVLLRARIESVLKDRELSDTEEN
jgi:DNA-binding response OmpR family regulator